MSISVVLHHLSHYRYDRPVQLSPQIIRLRPAPHCRTPILSYSLHVEPQTHFINWLQDPQSNYLARLVFPDPTRELILRVQLVAELSIINPFDFFVEPYAEIYPFHYEPGQQRELEPFFHRLPLTPRFSQLLDSVRQTGKNSVDYLVGLNQCVQRALSYQIRLEPGVQTPEDSLKLGSGSCRDSAWLLVQLLRHLGFAARFVSGYLIQLTADQKSLTGPAGPEQDFTDLHAWTEVYLPGAGWIGLDPTSGLLAGEGHIPLACTPEPSSAAPLSGLSDPCQAEFEHRMEILRLEERPRTTKPYDDHSWQQIDRLGRQVDADLLAADVRLTQGGEPTFVATDNPDSPEWNTDALGPTKKALGVDLLQRLKNHYAPGGLLHYGQGKWYPGEPLPRWSLNCFWRSDGAPIWRDPALFADPAKPGNSDLEAAKTFIEQLALRLDVGTEHLLEAYEDSWYYLWRERRLPSNLTPTDRRLKDPLERARLARIFEQGLGQIQGFVLPLAHRDGHWQSSSWYLRTDVLFLLPGDSPLGLRLPLESQPWLAETDALWEPSLDPFAPRPALAATGPRAPARILSAPQPDPARPSAWAPVQTNPIPVRTALSVEVRQGQLYLFLPPLSRLEDYLELVAAIEQTADALQQPLVIEGYEPPRDPRLQLIRITPDPGVLEVNVQPVHSWPELVQQTQFLYQSARELGLTAEKFMLDGRHSGTGGGSHLVLGGARAEDSPFLRRPDLLGSLIAFWHQHPSLSYLFSGLFIGPTSQAPRVDEARLDSLYELELALKQLPEPGVEAPPWLVDRLFRNLLIDVTGNTHRAEFCIDKLYSPDSATGRLGLLELRGFEMPPHPQMNLVQQLLVRALVARFWLKPYRPQRLTRWGNELHDRFMLPHFIWQDLQDVLAFLAEAGFEFKADWFRPHLEFRFPLLGQLCLRGIELELRQALEPWHVLGEEQGGGGTVRYVDSSLERLEVRLRGLSPDRYQLSVNGIAIPLHPTGVANEWLGAVRYRAWQPASCLQPNLPADSPLVFDLVDTWNRRSLGGCVYQVSHPGGRNFERYPVNAQEAEGRRLARFNRIQSSPGKLDPALSVRQADFPFTLDLRLSRLQFDSDR